MTSSGIVVAVSVGIAVVVFVVSTICFSVVAWAVLESPFSVITFSVALVVCTGKNMLSVSFSERAAVKASLTTLAVVTLSLLETSAFFGVSVRGFLESGSVSSAEVVTGASVVTSKITSTAAAVVSASVVTNVNDFS